MRTEPSNMAGPVPSSTARRRGRPKGCLANRTLSEWVSQTVGITICGPPANANNWASIVAANGIRTKSIPGTSYPLFYRPDVERVAAEAVRVGMPDRQASA